MKLILSAMSSTAASLHEETHEQLLRNLFQLHFWHTPPPILTSWTDLLLHLLYARPAFHQPCINHLVRNFYPPPSQLQQAARDAARDAEDAANQQPMPHTPSSAESVAHECIVGALNHVVVQHPLLRDTITAAVTTYAPHRYQPRVALCAHFRAVFALAGASQIASCEVSLCSTLSDFDILHSLPVSQSECMPCVPWSTCADCSLCD